MLSLAAGALLVSCEVARLMLAEVHNRPRRPSCPHCAQQLARHYPLGAPMRWVCFTVDCGFERRSYHHERIAWPVPEDN